MKTEKIGNKYLSMNDDHQLPVYYNKYFLYDRALPRIAKLIKEIDGELYFIDVGANIGDTVSLVTDIVDGYFLCIEGNTNYLFHLKKNLESLKKSKIVIEESYCGESCENIIIEEHDGTASIKKYRNVEKIKIKTLDEIINKNNVFYNANLLKIDTDGYDFSVLKSGLNYIMHTSPIIYFEFDPDLLKQNGFSIYDVFTFLTKCGYEEALIYNNYGLPIERFNISRQKEIEILINKIDKKNIYYYDVLTIPKNKMTKYSRIFDKEFSSVILYINNFLIQKQEELTATTKQLDQKQEELTATTKQLDQKQEELHKIYNSREWKLINKIKYYIRIIFPVGSFRRKLIIMLINILRNIKYILNIIMNYKIRFILKYKQKKPKQKLKININSKKILFVDHSFHNITKSSNFIIDYLKKYYEVELLFDDSWKTNIALDLSFINNDYLAVVFWQSIPNLDSFNNINNYNIIYFPMFDQNGGSEIDFWEKYKNVKIVNFSSTLHKKLVKWGFNSIYIQYFPEIKDFSPGGKDEVFFWQRLSFINIEIVKKLFGEEKKKIHLHQAVDPGHVFSKPNDEDIEKYQMTFSDWFENKNDILNLIKEKAIYIAPREYEGIGMSFLEAMSMGKLVIANNQPTMNEYIIDGETGLLFDWKNPRPLNFSNMNKIQENAYNFMKRGRIEWEKNIEKIIEFIEKE